MPPFFKPLARALPVFLLVLASGCANLPQPRDDGALQREAMAGTELPPPAPLPLDQRYGPSGADNAAPEIQRGSGRFIQPVPLATPRGAPGGAGTVTLNFENQPVQAVVKAILGDLLKKNYTIVPGVQGNVSFATAQPVTADQALPILEMLLSWTGNALVQRGDGYVVMPAKEAVAGNLVPGLAAPPPAAGLAARLFPLRYIGAAEMQKLIKPFARPDSVLLVDPARNLLVLAGTPEELDNYQRTIRTFDVDWLRGMSVGVFSLQRANVTDLVPRLEAMFGKNGDTPLAGMLRFLPIERTNALVVISTQPDYLTEVGQWIAQIDRGGGNEPQLFVYDVRNVKASDLARYLAQIYASGAGAGGGAAAGQVGPGLNAATLAGGTAMGSLAGGFGNPGGLNGSGGMNGGAGGMNGGYGNATAGVPAGGEGRDTGSGGGMITAGLAGQPAMPGQTAGGGDQQYSSSDGITRISSVDASNQLLVRTRPSQWDEIEAAIKRLDNVPLQVQIETRILEVRLTGQFSFGVQWYLEGLVGNTQSVDANGNVVVTPGQPGNQQQWALGRGGATYNPNGDGFFYSFINHDLQVALHAIEVSGNTKTLSAPSLVVLNNQVAAINVGDQVPINQTSVSTIGTSSTFNEVNYLTTGVQLAVQPRVNPGGLVYLNVQQVVSTPDYSRVNNGNPAVSARSMSTQIAVQSGQTVLLGGLIQQNEGQTDTGIPGLNRLPVVGRLFGGTDRNRNRTELIVLITPRVITSSEEARQVTDEYQHKFESLAPLRATGAPAGDRR